MSRTIGAMAAAALLAWPAAAGAAEVGSPAPGVYVYTAAAGEENDVKATVDAGRVTFVQTGGTLTTSTPGCAVRADTHGSAVECLTASTPDRVRLLLGDMDDDAASGAGDNFQGSSLPTIFEQVGGEGADTLTYTAPSQSPVVPRIHSYGGPGDDRFLTGEVVEGGDGNDYMVGLSNFGAVLNGGPGADRLLGPENVHFGLLNPQPSSKWDVVDYEGATQPVTVDRSRTCGQGAQGENDCIASGIDRIYGGEAGDRLIGTSAEDFFRGRAGDDVLLGLGGADDLNGMAGDDRLEGGDGDDTLGGDTGNDLLLGGDGRDWHGGNTRGSDVYDGGAGPDLFRGDPLGTEIVSYADRTGAVTASIAVQGQPADDGEAGEADDITHVDGIVGGTGDDTLSTTLNQPATLIGGPGSDTLTGAGGADTLDGREGNDVLSGAGGADALLGGDHDDALFGAAGADTLDAGLGNDRLDGGDDHDLLNAGAGADALEGGLGDDRLDGGTGGDGFSGGGGADLVLARDSLREEQIACGDGPDRAVVDPQDKVAADCEDQQKHPGLLG